MPLIPSNPRLLLLTKRMFSDGKLAAEVGDTYSAMRAVLLLDLAIEQALNLFQIDVPDTATRKPNEEPTWGALWTEASRLGAASELLSPLPHNKELYRLHRVRNMVQHHAHAPDPSEAHRFVVPVSGFLEKTFQALYGLSFSSYALAQAIRNTRLRRLILEAEYLVTCGSFFRAISATHTVFKLIGWALQPLFRKTDHSLSRIVGWTTEGPVPTPLRHVAEAVDSLREDLAMATLGLPLYDTGRFRATYATIHTLLLAGGDWQTQISSSAPEGDYEEAAKNALTFMTQLILVAQDAYPDQVDIIIPGNPLTKQERLEDIGASWEPFLERYPEFRGEVEEYVGFRTAIE